MFSDPYDIDFSARDPKQGVESLFFKRFSPRSFRKTEIPRDVLEVIFDSVRWSPSCYNEQPWLFLTSTAQTFDRFLDHLVEQNQQWARNASLLGFIIARRRFSLNGKENRWSVFDCGAAWMALTFAARRFGLYTHGMAGIRKGKIYESFQIPEQDFEVICGFALGALADKEDLPAELRDREMPSARKELSRIWLEGTFKPVSGE